MIREEWRGLTLFTVILIIFSAFFVIGIGAAVASPEQNVCRDLPAEAQPGDEITVELVITADGADRIIIDDMVPAGWTVTGASNGGVPDGNHVRWAKFGDDFVDTTYTYTVQIPGDAALELHTFSGVYKLVSGDSNAIDCDSSITVEVTSGGSSDSNNLETATIDEQEITTVNDQETATVNDPDSETDDESSSASTESASNTHKSVATTQSMDDSAEEVPASEAGSSMLVIVVGAIVIVSYKLKED